MNIQIINPNFRNLF